ncbi:MAG TPA: hypothetical protein VFH68_11455 [Polyangia bacterium]|nr:hypothetical protein [Polyangia bacterium]
MSEPEIATIKPLAIKGVRIVWPRLVAYRLDRLAVLEGRDLLMSFSLDDDKPRVREVRALGYKPQSLRLSPSRRFLLIGNETGNWYEVRDADKLEPVARTSGPERFACAFASLSEMDVLVSAPRAGVIEIMSLPDGALLSRVRREAGRTFVAAALIPVGDGDRVALVGHPTMSPFWSHMVVATSVLQAGGAPMNELLDRAAAARGCSDLAVGPSGWDDVLVYEGNSGPPPAGDRRTLTVRRLAGGEVLEQIPCDRVLSVKNPIIGTSLAVAIGFEEGVQLLPRKDLGAEPRFLSAKALSFDPDAGRLARVTLECEVELVELARV